jgi:Superfamily II helicase
MYICPLKALAREKYNELRDLSEGNFSVGLSTGDLDSGTDVIRRYDVIVCTSEKADSLMHHDPDYFNDIAVMVVDEIHNVGNPTRGPTLEVLCTISRMVNPELQIVGLSATLKNADVIGKWLNATVIKSDFRPVPLEKNIVFKDKIMNEDMEEIGRLNRDIYDLVNMILDDGGQVLIFLNTRKRTEKFAMDIATQMDTRYSHPDLDVPGEENERGVDILKKTVTHGVAFHHAGLNTQARSFVEENFKNGNIKIITATPTLAAGINLPARAVIIRDIARFSNGYTSFISNMEIEQMLGRAGRPKYDKYGVAYIYCQSPSAKDKIEDMFLNGVEPVDSAMGTEKIIRFNTLALISNGFCNSREDIYNFFDTTLYAYQHSKGELKDDIDHVVEYLDNYGFIKEKSGLLEPERLGKLTSGLYIDPETAQIILDMLESSETEPDPLMVLYNLCKTPDMMTLFVNRSDQDMLSGVFELFDIEDEEDMKAAKTAMLLNAWIDEIPLYEIEEQYNVGSGDIEGKISTGEWICMAASRIAAEYKREFAHSLDVLSLRIKEGVKVDIMKLITIPGVGRVRARRMYTAGLKTLDDICATTPGKLSTIKGISNTLALSIIKNAKSIGERIG